MRSPPVAAFVLAAVAPLIWGACAEAPSPASPRSSDPATAAAGPTDGPATAEVAASGGASPAVSGTFASGPPAPAAPVSGGAAAELEQLIRALPRRGAVKTTAQCQALIPPAQAALSAARAMSGACAADADCEVLPGSTCLSASCGVSVAKTARAAYEADRSRVTEAACGAWLAGGCDRKVPIPSPSCPMLVPVCKNGTCDTRY